MRYIKVHVQYFDAVPRWLVLQGEIDHRLFILEQMLKHDLSKPPIVRMIDEETGYDKQLTQEAEDLIAETRWLKREFDKEK